MGHQLEFDRIFRDEINRDGIFLPITLLRGEHSTQVEAQVDTGASCCIFDGALGESLGLEVESGFRQEINTVTGAFTTYGHTVTVSVFGFDFEAVVYFAADEGFTRNVLGRSGWLDRVKLGIVYHDSEVYLSSYE
jgi:predicted aspartyl protease